MRVPIETFWDLYDLELSVIPVHARSKGPPLVDWSKYRHRRADEAAIRKWLSRWPDANPAVITGRVSGVIVLDADGMAAKATLDGMGGVPATWTARTPNGHHYYFRYPRYPRYLLQNPGNPGNARRRIKNFVKKLPGLDLRADGGYVIAPGSIHPGGGAYAWESGLSPDDVPLADPPDWLTAILDFEEDEEEEARDGGEREHGMGHGTHGPETPQSNAGVKSRRTYGEAALRGEVDKVSRSTEGRRNDQLNRSAFALGQLVAGDVLDQAEVERELETAARSAGLGGDPNCGTGGIRATIRSGLRAGIRRPRRVTIAAENSSARQHRKQRSTVALSISSDLPMIDITNRQLRDITADALGALITANNPPVVFLRSGDLVRIRIDEHGRLRIEILRESHVCGRLARVANFVRYTRTGAVRHVPPPVMVVRDLAALGRWDLPVLEGVVEAPTMRADGSILDTPGYDAATRLLYIPAPGLHIPEIPRNPSRDDVRRSLSLLDDAFGDFPYVDQASHANMLALLLTCIVRQSFKGHVPLALIDAPRAGTGKTLAVEAVSQITTGRTAALMSAPAGDEEFRKRLTSVLLDGPTVVTIDNIENRLSSPSFASVLTAHNWHDRMLGTTGMVTLPQRATWIATGNNIKLGGDMPRRCYWIRLDTQLARPWQRPTEGFRHPNLLGWVSENRGELLAALITIARAWFVAGKPVAEVPPLGSFEAWARTVGGILAFAGVQGFLQNLDALYEQNDEESSEWEAFLVAWSEVFGGDTVTVADLCDTLLPAGASRQQSLAGTARSVSDVSDVSDEQVATLREALPGEIAEGLEIEQKRSGSVGNVVGGSAGTGFRRKLGKALAKRIDVRYGDLRLEKASGDAHAKVSRWRVRDMRDMRG